MSKTIKLPNGWTVRKSAIAGVLQPERKRMVWEVQILIGDTVFTGETDSQSMAIVFHNEMVAAMEEAP